MTARFPDEAHRTSTPLELFFDLCFVVAVSQASTQLHHALAADDGWWGPLHFLLVFFAIWWAWMNFTWFASAYDNDDVLYRLVTLVEITGALILAAGIPEAFSAADFTTVFVGYLVLRLGLVIQWLRAAHDDPPGRGADRRYAAGVSMCMVGWFVVLLLGWPLWGWFVMAAMELTVPLWAERGATTAWHPGHIAERYGLFTLIVLGESVLSSTVAVQFALDRHRNPADVYLIAVGGLLTVFAMWWLYFAKPAHSLLTSNRVAFVWGYGHYIVFGSAAAVGAGIAVNVDRATQSGHAGAGEVSALAAGAAISVPVALFLIAVWALHVRPHHSGRVWDALFPVTAVVVLVVAFTAQPVLAVGLVLALLTGASIAITAQSGVGSVTPE
jgi:low temperature requirement protein LtrA